MELQARNVNDALALGVKLMRTQGRVVPSRNGDTVEIPVPVITHQSHPCERVIYNPSRDANPFFHFMEALWVLAGRQDVAFLRLFNKRMEEYSDDGRVYHAPYGYRLRTHFGRDQLAAVIHRLKRDTGTRHAVLQIWDVNADLNATTKDLPCNDLLFVLIRDHILRLTVCCRSNDMVWGAFGSNSVVFSTLLEYLAGMIGVGCGPLTQVSNSLHAYVEQDAWKRLRAFPPARSSDPYTRGSVKPFPLVACPRNFDQELSWWLADPTGEVGTMYGPQHYLNPIFPSVATALYLSWVAHKHGDKALALKEASECAATDWRRAAIEWLQRRN